MDWINRDDGTEAPVLGTYGLHPADVASLADWTDTALWALVRLRTGAWRLDGSRDAATLSGIRLGLTDVSQRLLPRLEGLTDALIRAHHAAGGSLGELGDAMDVARSTAQHRSTRVASTQPPQPWERWAAGEAEPAQVPAVDLRPGWTLVTPEGRHVPVLEVEVHADGAVSALTGERGGSRRSWDHEFPTATAVSRAVPVTTTSGVRTEPDGTTVGITIYTRADSH